MVRMVMMIMVMVVSRRRRRAMSAGRRASSGHTIGTRGNPARTSDAGVVLSAHNLFQWEERGKEVVGMECALNPVVHGGVISEQQHNACSASPDDGRNGTKKGNKRWLLTEHGGGQIGLLSCN
jgi:hypothetical protein